MKVEYISTFFADVTAFAEFLDKYPRKARRILKKLDRILERLPDLPKLHPIYEDYPEFRKIVIEDYLVFYKIIDGKKLIEVHRLLYGGMDIRKQLGSENKLDQNPAEKAQ